MQRFEARYFVKPSMPSAGIDLRTSDGSNVSIISKQSSFVTLEKPEKINQQLIASSIHNYKSLKSSDLKED